MKDDDAEALHFCIGCHSHMGDVLIALSMGSKRIRSGELAAAGLSGHKDKGSIKASFGTTA